MGQGWLRLAVLAVTTAALATPAAASAEPAAVPGQLIVGFSDSASSGDRADARAQAGTRIEASLRLDGAQVVQTTGGQSVAAAARELNADPAVDYAEPNYVYSVQTTPNDPSYPSQWDMAKIDAPSAWGVTTGSASVKVGIVDTGVQWDHPDLAANVDPQHGDDFIGGCTSGGWSSACGDSDPTDQHGHGTHVAGTIGAAGNNGVGVSGVNWRSDLLAARVCDAGGSCPDSAIAEGIDYAGDQGAKVVNISLGGGGPAPGAIDQAIDDHPGTLFVIAAGNASSNDDLTPSWPCNFSLTDGNVLCVASTDSNDALSSFSNYGIASVGLAAPGRSIYSTYYGSSYTTMSGTSMATPHVTGAAALLFAAVPTASVSQVKQALLDGVDPLAGLQGKTTSGGRLNVSKSMTALGQQPPPAPAPSSPPASGGSGGSSQGSSGGSSGGGSPTPVAPAPSSPTSPSYGGTGGGAVTVPLVPDRPKRATHKKKHKKHKKHHKHKKQKQQSQQGY
jgi:subtilisin family serine protease